MVQKNKKISIGNTLYTKIKLLKSPVEFREVKVESVLESDGVKMVKVRTGAPWGTTTEWRHPAELLTKEQVDDYTAKQRGS